MIAKVVAIGVAIVDFIINIRLVDILAIFLYAVASGTIATCLSYIIIGFPMSIYEVISKRKIGSDAQQRAIFRVGVLLFIAFSLLLICEKSEKTQDIVTDLDIVAICTACFFVYDYIDRIKRIIELKKEIQYYQNRTHSEFAHREAQLKKTMSIISSRFAELHKKEEELGYIRIELGEKEKDIMWRSAVLNQREREYQKGGDAFLRNMSNNLEITEGK